MEDPSAPTLGSTDATLTRTRSTAWFGAVRFGGDLSAAGFALLTGVVTARSLGPVGKGAFSALSYFVALLWPIAAVGAGEAAVTLLGRRTTTMERSLGSTYVLLAATGLALAPVLWLLTSIPAFGVVDMRGGRLAGLLALPLTAASMTLAHFAEFRHHFVLTSAARVVAATVTLTATLLLVTQHHLFVYGAMLGLALGQAAGVAVLLVGFALVGLPLRPAWDRDYVRRALRIGIPVQFGLVMVIGAARLDVLIVAAFRSAEEAGVYSVALSVAQLASLAPVALAYATAPRVAGATTDEAGHAVRQALRLGTIAAVLSAAAIAVTTSWLVPLVFGHGFRGAIGPAWGLLPGAIATGVQWIAARAAAARGRSLAFPRTFGTSLVVLIVLDLFLVPTFGLAGAAAASSVAYLAGLSIAIWDVRAATKGRPGPVQSHR